MKVLCVAEKPSIAKAVSQILAGGHFQVSGTNNKYIKNYKFTSRFPQWGECDVVFTSVAGHLTEADFDGQWRKWTTCAPVALFEEARVIETIPQVHCSLAIIEIRVPRGFTTTLSRRAGRPVNCLYGPTVTERENILDLKSSAQRKRGMPGYKSSEPDSTTWNERISSAVRS